MVISPTSIAIEAGNARIDYGNLDRQAGMLARRLRDRGIGTGALVAVCLPRSIEQIVAMLAIWRAGAGYLPLDPAWPRARLAHLLDEAACAAIIAEKALGTSIAGNTELVVPRTAEQCDPISPVPRDSDSLAYVIYTSGSTGAPKAVEVSHGNLQALIAWHRDAFALDTGTRTSCLAGPGFDAAAWEIWPTLAAGGTLSLVDDATRTDPAVLRDWLVSERIEVAFAPTALAEPMVALEWPESTPLRTLLTGADTLTVRPHPNLPFAFHNNYGPTECTVVATSGLVEAEGDGLPTIGKPIAGTTVHLLDDDGMSVADGEQGEIWIGGAQVACGYRGDPALTAKRFCEHPRYGRLYRSGDLGVLLPSGEIAFRGRIDSQVKIRGHRLEPAEVAAAINRLPDVRTSTVIVREGELIAYVVPLEGVSVTADAMRKGLADTLPDYMVPARFGTLAALPLTSNGKIDAAALPEIGLCAMAEKELQAGRAAKTATEKRLLAIVAGVIQQSDVGVDDDFFLLGGHSLLGTQVVVQARDAFAVELTLFHLFEGRTVARLAEIVEALVTEKLDAMSDDDILRVAG